MNANQLYGKLEHYFIKPQMRDDWAPHMVSVEKFISENFKKRSMGLVCDFTTEINEVYTAVFPSDVVMRKVLDSGAKNALLFVHHPAIWDIRKAPEVFQQMNKELLQDFKKRKISIYNLHVPLDDFGKYSTSVTLAQALGLIPEKSFAPYFGALCGVYCKTSFTTIQELNKKFQDAVGHDTKVYTYGDNKIKNKYVAVIAGGGNSIEILEELTKDGINTFVTGITAKNSHSQKAHDFARKNELNILGGTHYSTEKFACMAMVKYFKKEGLPAQFVDDVPVMEDM